MCLLHVKVRKKLPHHSRGTPRIANRLLRRVRDYAQVKGTGEVNPDARHKPDIQLPVAMIIDKS